MQQGWGEWSPLAGELSGEVNAWREVSAEQQCQDRPYDYLPDLPLVLQWAERAGGPILDLACGNGRLSLALARHGYDVVGLDFNSHFIARAREEAGQLPAETAGRVRFEVGDVRTFRLPERFGLVIMMDQAFKYLLHHDDHLSCLQAVRHHLRPDGLFLVEHRCVLRIPDGTSDPYTDTYEGRQRIVVDVDDPILQVGAAIIRPENDPEGAVGLDACRFFTYQELSLLHRVAGFRQEAVLHDLDERGPGAVAVDVALVLRPAKLWGPEVGL